MRKIKWILLPLLVVFTVQISGYIIWRVSGADNRIRQMLVEKVRPFLAAGSDIRELKVSLTKIHLKNITVVPKDQSFLLQVEDLQLGYSLWNLIKYRFRVSKIAHDIILVHPIVVLKKVKNDKQRNPNGQTWADYQKMIDSFNTVKKIAIVGAEIQAENETGRRSLIAQALDGLMTTDPLDSAFFRLTGKLFASRNPNIRIEGQIDLRSVKLRRLYAKLDESDPSSNLSSLFPSFIEVKRGKIKGEARFEAAGGISGYLNILDWDFRLKNAGLHFTGMNLRGLFKDQGIVFSGGVERLNGSRIGVGGYVQNLLDPQMDIHVNCSRFNIPAFVHEMNPNITALASTGGMLHFHITGSPARPHLEGEVTADSLRGFGLYFDKFQTAVQIMDSVLTLQGTGENPKGLNLQTNAFIPLTSSKRGSLFHLSLEGDMACLLPVFLQNSVKGIPSRVELNAAGGFKKLHGEVTGKITLISLQGTPFELFPNCTYQNNLLNISVVSNEGFHINGKMDSPFQRKPKWEIESREMEQLLGVMDKNWFVKFDSLKVDAKFSGTPKKWELTARCSDPRRTGQSQQVFSAQLAEKQRDRIQRQVDLSCRYFGPQGSILPLDMVFLLSREETVLQRCEIGDFFTASARIPRLKSHKEMTGDFKLQNGTFECLHPFFPSLKPFRGKLNGQLKLKGTADQPAIRLDLSLRNGKFHDIGTFEADLAAEWQNRFFNFLSISMQKDDVPLLAGSIRPVSGDSLLGTIQSGKLVLRDLAQAMTGNKDIVNGEATLHVRASGKRSMPVLTAEVDIGEGTLGKMAFREFKAIFQDTLFPKTGLQDGVLVVREGRLVCEDGFKIDFFGAIPHGGSKSVDLTVSAKGNLLGFLSETSPFFRKGESEGELFLRFGGRPDNTVLRSGRIRIDNGTMELKSVTSQIDKIRCEAKLEEGDSLFQISKLTGQIRGGVFSLTNNRIGSENPEMKPLRLKRFGINLGILNLTTESKGIPLHFPGLMAKGEEGWIAFAGLKKKEPFVIGGPVESPLLQGTLYVRANQLTYPFLTEADESGTHGMNQVLNSIRWNIKIIPQKGVHYIRDIESPFGNVYVDLQVQDGFGGVSINGCLKDHSFLVWGNLVSVEGTLEALDRYFRPERITFDYPKGGSPIFSGRASTTVVDSMGVPSTVWLNLVSVDQKTGIEGREGPLKNVQFRFSTDNPNLGRTEADLLGSIGYSETSMKNRAYDAIGMQVENRIFRPIFKPLEKGMRRYLGFDIVKFSSMFSRNLFEMQNAQAPVFDPILLLRSSKLTLGKSFFQGLMLVYTGEIQNDLGYRYAFHGIGLRHSLALEYAIRPELLLEMEYTYDNQLLYERRQDKRIWLRHVFPF
jgi:hypothetical protein